MVPFYQWKLSHRNHHKNTGNMDKDEVFYPVRRSQQDSKSRLLPGFALGLGWIIYLAVGYYNKYVSLILILMFRYTYFVLQCKAKSYC